MVHSVLNHGFFIPVLFIGDSYWLRIPLISTVIANNVRNTMDSLNRTLENLSDLFYPS